MNFTGSAPQYSDFPASMIDRSHTLLHSSRPDAEIIPILAKRNSAALSQDISLNTYNNLSGDHTNMAALVDKLAARGHSQSKNFEDAVSDVLGFAITSSQGGNGKLSGTYENDDHFISISQMGDGVAAITYLIACLLLDKQKVFLIDEPEASLHPKAIKSLIV